MSRSEEETDEIVGEEGGGTKSLAGSNIFPNWGFNSLGNILPVEAITNSLRINRKG